MNSWSDWAIYIVGLIGLIVFVAIVERLYHSFRYKRRVATLDNYDRTLSPEEESFFNDAIEKLANKRSEKESYPRWYGVFLYFGFLPMMGLCLIVGFVLYGLVSTLFPNPEITFKNALLIENLEVGTAFFFGIMAFIILPAPILYTLTLRSTRLSNYVALESDLWGFDSDAIHARQVNLINHRIRARIIKLEDGFDADVFLAGRNKSYQKGCMNFTLGLLSLGLIFLFFDLNYFRVVYPDRIESSGSYFNLGSGKIYNFNKIDRVELNCYFYEGNPRGNYNLYSEGKKFVSFSLIEKNLQGLSELDNILRREGTRFEPRVKTKGEEVKSVFLTKKCVEALAKDNAPNEALIEQILHLDKGLPR